ncbi:hypothetical protein [Vibrio caribbeanicus]|uniref:hypothetical protein n=1 Tax=Vibrio caribbeanicus TaxID=701175 RepID=UPI0030DA0905
MKKLVLTSIAMSIFTSYSSLASTNSEPYCNSYGMGGSQLEIKAKNDGRDFVLPNCYSSIKATVADSAWSERVLLPRYAKKGSSVIVKRTSQAKSYIVFNSRKMPISIGMNSQLKFTFNGIEWLQSGDVHQVTPIDGTDLVLSNDYSNIKVTLADGAWAKNVILPRSANKSDYITVKRSSQADSYIVFNSSKMFIDINTEVNFTYTGTEWVLFGNEYNITPINGKDVNLPDGYQNINVDIKDYHWTAMTRLPKNPQLGTVVTIRRSSDWETSVNDGRKHILIPPHSTLKFVWNGDVWKNVSVQNYGVTKLKNSSMHEVSLNLTQPKRIDSVKVKPTNIVPVNLPRIVTLKDMAINSGYFVNKTPYSVNDIFIERDGVVKHIKFTGSVGEYSQAYIGSEYNGYVVVNQSNIANNKIDFRNENIPSSGQPRYANTEERDSVERVQMYERFWINSPNALDEITQRIDEQCETNIGRHGYAECYYYDESKLDYTTDMYFAQSVSGFTSKFWIDPEVWGAAEGNPKKLATSWTFNSSNLWMSPKLMRRMLSDDADIAIDADQGLIHEYYHNLGFGHESGWASNQGIDDLFGKKAYYEYRDILSDKMFNANIVTDIERVDDVTYKISLSSIGSVSDLSMRILSTENIQANVAQFGGGINDFILKFDEPIQTDVYVSIFSSESLQMSTIKLRSDLF